MFIANTTMEIGLYKSCLIAKTFLNIVFTIVPIIIIITGIIAFFKPIISGKQDDIKLTLSLLARKIIAGLIVLMLPTLIEYSCTLLEGEGGNNIFKYYSEATTEKLTELENQYDEEQATAKAKEEAEAKELLLLQKEEEDKKRETLEEERTERESQNSSSSSSSGSSSSSSSSTSGGSSSTGSVATGSGTYGSLTVKDGVFYIPNKRATSDADTPKQSGAYGVNPIFWERLSKLISDAKKQGYSITVTSGWRSYSSQLSLWNKSTRACSVRSKWVACPGGSRHGFGIAADLSFNGTSCSGNWNCNAAATWVHNNAANYGLKFRMSWEPWHIEPDNVQGGSFGSCNAKC